MSLFAKPAATSSLFGSPAAQPAATSSPFGNLGGAAKPAATTGGTTSSLFGNLTGSTAAPSLFSTSTSNTAQTAATTATPATTSLFGAKPAQPASQLNQSTNALGAPSNPLDNGMGQPPPTGAYFDSLAAKSKKQANGDAPMEDLPSLQLGLGDLRQRLRKLGPQATGAGQSLRATTNGRAHYLLAASGVDPGAAVKDLGAFGATLRSSERPTQSASVATEVDVDAYLSNLQTKTTMAMIQDSLDRSARDFDAFLEDNVTMEWEAQRRRIYEHFGIQTKSAGGAGATPGREGAAFGRSRRRGAGESTPGKSTMRASAFERSGMQKSVIGTASRIGAHRTEFTDVHEAEGQNGAGPATDRFLREKEGRLADRIHALNDQRLQNASYSLLHELRDACSTSNDRHASQLADAYQALIEIVMEKPDNDPDAPVRGREREYADAYLDLNTNSGGAIAFRKQLLAGANRFLETQFVGEVEAAIAKNPQDANLGGRPDVLSKIKAYVRLLAARKHLAPDNIDLQQVQGEFVWAIVFYLLRSGHVKEAATYVNDNQNHFRNIDRTFPGYLNSYATSPDRRLSRQLQERCNNEYNQRARNAPDNSIDPYRMACYKIIGRCELQNRSFERLNTDVNDWIWLQFNLAREVDRTAEIAGELFGLSEVQSTIREIGNKHFPKNSADDSNGGNFGMFFYLQVLSGMFEQAIAYLYSFSYVDAVHFAIGLEYYGLLRATNAAGANANELLSHTTRNQPQINFDRMVGYYTKDFRAANVAAAVDYILLICLNIDDANNAADREHAAFCHAALTDLVLETREFSKLIGDIRPDGQRIPGIVESRGAIIGLHAEQDVVKNITLRAASFADDNGRTTDAVLLYHLAEGYDSVVQILARTLSEAVAIDVGQDPMRLVPVKPRADVASASDAQPGSSLSLASIDDPVELASVMMHMYEKDQFFRDKISDANRTACDLLLRMAEIKGLVAAGQWPQCLDHIRALGILPLDARGDPSTIRSYASRFAALAQPVAVNVPHLLLWTVVCCTQQREALLASQFTSGNQSTARTMAGELKQVSMDLTTYTSQLRYRFPPHVHEALARACAE